MLPAPLLLLIVAAQPADLVVVNANVWTVDPDRPRATALAVRDGKILFVGGNRGAEALAGPHTKRLDLHGQTVIPGMVDAHAHLLGLGRMLRDVDLVGTRSYDEVIARVRARAATAPAGTWIRGRGWDQNDWANTSFPTAAALDRAVPDHPVFLKRVDGHAALLNARGLALAGITKETPDPEGGRILRDAGGAPTGVLIDEAADLAEKSIPADSRAETRAAIVAAVAEANRHGLTGIHDAGVSADLLGVYEELAREGRFPLRDYVMLRDEEAVLDRFMARGPRDALDGGRIWVRSIKIIADGALGSRGAALLEDYADEPGNRGLVTFPDADVRRIAVKALRSGFQLCVHAIGDRANRSVLDAYSWALQQVEVADHRFRVEHAQVISPTDIPRFAALDVIPSMQGSHQTSDMDWVPARIGWERSRGAYAWRSLLDTGVRIPNGSDFPVEAVDPLISFRAFFTRTAADGHPTGGWIAAERTTREEALRSITIWPAYAAFMEDVSGSLTPGKYADLVVLDRDVMTVPEKQIPGTRVLLTVLGGQVVYRAENVPKVSR